MSNVQQPQKSMLSTQETIQFAAIRRPEPAVPARRAKPVWRRIARRILGPGLMVKKG